MTSLDISNLRKNWGNSEVLKNLSLSVASGEFISLLGPSGCGKTTILRIIAGLIEPTGGSIRLGGLDLTEEPAHRRQIGLVFQSYALFPHLTVMENVAFGLKRRGLRGGELGRRVGRALESVRLEPLAQRYPRELSGGQQQRVALARATVIEPQLLLLDEPLSNLDAVLRVEMGGEIKRLQRELGITTVFVTHDQVEALTMSDRICLLNHGEITQLTTPEEIYLHPASTFVATFMGRANILKAEVAGCSDGRITGLIGSGGQISGTGPGSPGETVSFAVRQQSVALELCGPDASAGVNRLPGTVSFAAFAGSSRHYVVRLDAGLEISTEAPAGAGVPLKAGDRVIASWKPEEAIVVVEDEVFH